MKITKPILALAAGTLMITGGMALPASASSQQSGASNKQVQSKAKEKSVTGISQGTIKSISSDRLVLSHEKDGKAEDMTFVLNPKTERKGSLTTGTQVSVHYRNENNQMMATSIQAVPQAASNAKKPATKK